MSVCMHREGGLKMCVRAWISERALFKKTLSNKKKNVCRHGQTDRQRHVFLIKISTYNVLSLVNPLKTLLFTNEIRLLCKYLDRERSKRVRKLPSILLLKAFVSSFFFSSSSFLLNCCCCCCCVCVCVCVCVFFGLFVCFFFLFCLLNFLSG